MGRDDQEAELSGAPMENQTISYLAPFPQNRAIVDFG
jgi:hypothetical protein